MVVHIIIKDEYDNILHTDDLEVSEFSTNRNHKFTFTLLNDTLTYILESPTTDEKVEGSYTHTNDVIKNIVTVDSFLSFNINNKRTYTYTETTLPSHFDRTLYLIVYGKHYFGDPENVLKKRLTDICNAIRSKFNTTQNISANYIDDEIRDGQDGVQRMIDSGKTLDYMFYKYKGTDLTFIPTLNLSSITSAQYAFSELSSATKLTLRASSITSMQYMCANSPKLHTVDLLVWNPSTYSAVGNTFYKCYSLEKVILRNVSNTYCSSSTFGECYKFTGTTNSTYNPTGEKLGAIYVPSDKVDQIKNETVTSSHYFPNYNIRAIFSYTNLGEGEILKDVYDYGTLLTPLPKTGYTFNGWYTGEIKTGYRFQDDTLFDVSISDVEGQTYKFTLRDDGYYESNNKGVSSSTAYGRFYFTVTDLVRVKEFKYISYGESNYDYGTYYLYKSNGTSVFSMTQKSSSASVVTKTTEFQQLSPGEYYLEVRYQKDSSGNSGNDSFRVKLTMGECLYEQYIDGELYSSDATINVGIVDEQTMEPLNLIAHFIPESEE